MSSVESRYSLHENMSKIKAPTQIIWGKDDKVSALHFRFFHESNAASFDPRPFKDELKPSSSALALITKMWFWVPDIEDDTLY